MGVVEAGWSERGWAVGQAGGQAGGGADVSRAGDELHAKTQSHRCLRYSLEQEGGGRENRNNIKSQAVLTHSPAGHHTVNRLYSTFRQTANNAEDRTSNSNRTPELYVRCSSDLANPRMTRTSV